MQTIKAATSEFLGNRRIAVTGVSRHPESRGSNAVPRKAEEESIPVLDRRRRQRREAPAGTGLRKRISGAGH
ncbi:MAG: hypothetical protein ACRDT6_04960 [Micromonosporaceae bacterium]